jgi:MiaB/RimO family radical SAM methylthiotransferase
MCSKPDERSESSWIGILAGQKICVLTFGCTYNAGDSSRLRAILGSAGCLLVCDPEEAGVIILNSCVVIEKTERKMIRLLRDLVDRGKEVWITGCLPSARGDILHEFPSVRILLPDDVHAIPGRAISSASGPVAVVQTGSGCLGHCSYCITRLARGRIRSIPQEEIIGQVREAVCRGAVEIRLTGQDLSAYGCDQEGPALPSLLRQISRIEGDFRVRLGMMNPATLTPIIGEVADTLQHGHLFSFVHLPVQSGSDTVLHRMERGYSVSGYLDLVRILRETVPGISITTDLIAGFPRESEEEFRATCDLLMAVRPEGVNVTRYSYRPGSTVSRDYELPDRILKDRSRALIRIGYQILKEQKQQMVGGIYSVVITERLKTGTVMGRTDTYTGVVIHEDLPVGDRHIVEITGERVHYLVGKVIYW